MAELSDPVRLLASQRDRASEVLVRAFQDDPMYVHIIADVNKRVQVLRLIWTGLIKYSLIYGEVYTTPTVEGVACWLSPGKTRVTFWRMLRTGMGLAWPVLKLGQEDRRRFFAVMNYVDDIHKRLVPEPHWYLWALGVDPQYQRQGIGGKLIEPVLVRSDAEELPCYLETDTEQNVVFYQKHGFEVVSEGQVPGNNFTLWTMLRKPK